MHHATDPARFMLADALEKGYERWFERELSRQEAVILVACRRDSSVGDEVLGYAYGTVEARDWNMLLDAHGAIHDVYVCASERGRGTGRRLVQAMVKELESHGAKRIVLFTMIGNEAAQRVFRDCGFRATMLEMTRSE